MNKYIVAYYNIPNGHDFLKVYNLEDRDTKVIQEYYNQWLKGVEHVPGLKTYNNTWWYVTEAKSVYEALDLFWTAMKLS